METTPLQHDHLTQSEPRAASVVQKTLPPPLALDAAKYQHYLAEMALTDAQQAQLLTALWHIMKRFVELGFGLDPVQQILTGVITKAWECETSDLEKDETSAITGNTTNNNEGRS